MAKQPTRAPAAVPQATADPACRTCPFWRARGDGQGVCHGSAGPLVLAAGAGLFGVTRDDDWCRLHPAAPAR